MRRVWKGHSRRWGGRGRITSEAGLTLIEVLMASVVASIGLAGGVALLHWAEQGRQFGALGTRALAMATSKVEVKRASPWNRLLVDVSDDGQSETAMTDDGKYPDVIAGDGLYTGSRELDGIVLTWTVEPSQRGILATSGHVTIRARADYRMLSGRMRTVEVGTLRGNPNFVGAL